MVFRPKLNKRTTKAMIQWIHQMADGRRNLNLIPVLCIYKVKMKINKMTNWSDWLYYLDWKMIEIVENMATIWVCERIECWWLLGSMLLWFFTLFKNSSVKNVGKIIMNY
jgi:hypothetical protein